MHSNYNPSVIKRECYNQSGKVIWERKDYIEIKQFSIIIPNIFLRKTHSVDQRNTIINQETFKVKPGDIIDIPGFDNESGLVDRVSKNTAWVFLENLGYTIKLSLA